MRLLSLDERVQEFVKNEKISAGHARTILALKDGDEQFEIAKNIIDTGISVRETEKIVKNLLSSKNKKVKNKNSNLDISNYNYIEEKLKNILGTKVKIKNGKNKGAIEIEYYSNDDLDRIMGLINKIIN